MCILRIYLPILVILARLSQCTVQGSPVITLSHITTEIHTLFPPSVNRAAVRVLAQDVVLQCNLIGKWLRPDNTSIINSTIEFPIFTVNHAGLYRFYMDFNVDSSNSTELLAIQISISIVGTNFAEMMSPGLYTILSGNNAFYTEITLVCATNDTSQQIQWVYQPNQNTVESDITGSSDWDSVTGISTVGNTTSPQGYYSCKIANGAENVVYTAAIFDSKLTVVATTNMTYYYIKGKDPSNVQLLCTQDNSTVELNKKTWNQTLSGVVHNNPLVIDTIASVGSLEFVCNIDDATISTIELIIHVPSVTMNYTGFEGEIDNALSPEINYIEIPLYAAQVTFSTNILSGTWLSPISTIHINSIRMELFTLIYPGKFSFTTKETWNGEETEIFLLNISSKGSIFAIINGQNEYIASPINSFFFATTELVCTSEANTYVIWGHQQNFEEEPEFILATTHNGIGIFNAKVNQPGYYVCITTMNGIQTSHFTGIFDPAITTDITSGATYNYTMGVDNSDIQLVCDPMDTSIQLRNVSWLIFGKKYPNPVVIKTIETSQLPNKIETSQLPDTVEIVCIVNNNADVRVRSTLLIQGMGRLIVTYEGTHPQNFIIQPPDINIIQIPTFARDIVIENSLLFGSWSETRGGIVMGTDLHFNMMSLQHNGDIDFSVRKWQSNSEVIVIQIRLVTIGTGFGRINEFGEVTTLANNTSIQISSDVSIVCATNSSTSIIEWSYSIVTNDDAVTITKVAAFNTETGFSILTVSPGDPGYYSCDIDGIISYGLLVLDPSSSIITKTDFDNLLANTYTAGAPTILFYNNTDVSITDSTIRWTPDTIVPNEDTEYALEFGNPVNLNEVFYSVGTGNFRLTCFYRMSPARVLGSINLDIRDSVVITITYEHTTLSFDDSTNSNYPLAETLDILVLTNDIRFDCSLTTCLWLFEPASGSMEIETASNTYTIDTLRLENEGKVSIKRISSNGTVYKTASVSIFVAGAFVQRIASIMTQFSSPTSFLISWGLDYASTPVTNESFTIYYGIGNVDRLAGTTQNLWYNLTGLISNQNYSVLIELNYAFSTETTSKQTHYFLEYTPVTPVAVQDVTTVVIVVAVILTLLLVLGILVILLIFLIWLNMGKAQSQYYVKSNLRGEEPVDITDLTEQRKIDASIKCSHYANPTFDENLQFSEEPPLVSLSSEFYKNATYVENTREENPYSEPIQLENYKHHLDTIWEQRNALEYEYKTLGGSALRYPYDAAKEDGNVAKNKFRDTVPYNKSRVILGQDVASLNIDYINASHIPGVYVPHRFIATQGPKENTIEDFWQMVIEQDVNEIVMVTKLDEGGKQKCERYFTTEHYPSEVFGCYKVVFQREDVFVSYIIRQMTVSDGFTTKEVRQFHFTAWPDHDVPTVFNDLLQFVNTVKQSILNVNDPILVHCSAGVGRTGTFITIFNLLQQVQNQQPISIYRIVDEMREHRPQMVQTFRQYKFLYLSVLELLYVDTSIPANEFIATYQDLLESDSEGGVSFLFEQYFELQYQCEKVFSLDCSHAMEDINISKNPIKTSVPCNKNRVVLSSHDLQVEYINATYLDSYKFIVTIHPIEDTLIDFLQMVYQTEASMVIMLTTPYEFAEIINEQSPRVPYWPNMPELLDAPPFRTEVLETEQYGGLIRNRIKLSNWNDNTMRTFTQIISTSWNENDEITKIDEIICLLDLMQQEEEMATHRPIVLHCIDGIGKSGVVYTVYKSIQSMQRQSTVDIFHLVKQLRNERMNFVPSLINYMSCYYLLSGYCTEKEVFL